MSRERRKAVIAAMEDFDFRNEVAIQVDVSRLRIVGLKDQARRDAGKMTVNPKLKKGANTSIVRFEGKSYSTPRICKLIGERALKESGLPPGGEATIKQPTSGWPAAIIIRNITAMTVTLKDLKHIMHTQEALAKKRAGALVDAQEMEKAVEQLDEDDMLALFGDPLAVEEEKAEATTKPVKVQRRRAPRSEAAAWACSCGASFSLSEASDWNDGRGPRCPDTDCQLLVCVGALPLV